MQGNRLMELILFSFTATALAEDTLSKQFMAGELPLFLEEHSQEVSAEGISELAMGKYRFGDHWEMDGEVKFQRLGEPRIESAHLSLLYHLDNIDISIPWELFLGSPAEIILSKEWNLEPITIHTELRWGANSKGPIVHAYTLGSELAMNERGLRLAVEFAMETLVAELDETSGDSPSYGLGLKLSQSQGQASLWNIVPRAVVMKDGLSYGIGMGLVAEF